MSTNEMDSTRRIRELNDAFRKSMARDVFCTRGVVSLGRELQAKAIEATRIFAAFTPDNDPHGEHDFGGFDISEQKFFWKIDYYDPTLHFGSDDPSDPEKTRRILTIMLAEEY